MPHETAPTPPGDEELFNAHPAVEDSGSAPGTKEQEDELFNPGPMSREDHAKLVEQQSLSAQKRERELAHQLAQTPKEIPPMPEMVSTPGLYER